MLSTILYLGASSEKGADSLIMTSGIENTTFHHSTLTNSVNQIEVVTIKLRLEKLASFTRMPVP
jgi:hypothetical protein